MESLFPMQRYWGSDEEEDNEEKNNSICNFSGNNCIVPNKKPKLDVSVIEIDDEDKSSGEDSDSPTNNISSKNTHRRKKELESSVVIVSSRNSDFSNKLSSASDTDNEIEFLCDVKNNNHCKTIENENCIEKAHGVKSNKSKKKENHKLKHPNVQEKEIKPSETSSESSGMYLKEAIHAAENSISKKKKKKHKLNESNLQESGKDFIPLEINISEETESSDEAFSAHSKETAQVAKNKALKKEKKKQTLKNNNTNAQENEDFIALEINTSQEAESSDENLDVHSKEAADVVKNSASKKDKEHKLSNSNAPQNECVFLETNAPQDASSEKKKKRKLNNSSVEDIIPSETKVLPQKAENTDETFCTLGQVHHQRDKKVSHALPHWLSHPTYISVNLLEEETSISELEYLDSNTKSNLKDVGIHFLFPVQLAVIPWLMQSKKQSLLIRPSDICVSAPTGSGKTLAFVLPIVQSLKDRMVCAIRALVVLPVSELAFQVYKVFETFTRGTDLKVALLTGQKSFVAEQNAVVRLDGKKIRNLVDIVVATPGRLLDHIHRTNGFCLKRLRYLVIDEADRMMEDIQEGLLKEVEDAVFQDCINSDCVCSSFKRTSFEATSAYTFGFITQPLQKLLYSATLTHDPEQLYSLSLYKPKLFTTSSASSEQEFTRTCTIPSELNMLQVVCEEGVKPMVICHLIKHCNFKRVLCFTETVERAHRLHLVLEKMGVLQVREISSFSRPVQRKIALEQFSSGKISVLVCSDLVARGIDIEDIDCVISYDVPQFVKMYIHRIGRTARAGKAGTAITLLSEGEIPSFKKMLTPIGIKMPEKISIGPENLKPFVSSYKTALSEADAKLKKEKLQGTRKSKKRKNKPSEKIN